MGEVWLILRGEPATQSTPIQTESAGRYPFTMSSFAEVPRLCGSRADSAEGAQHPQCRSFKLRLSPPAVAQSDTVNVSDFDALSVQVLVVGAAEVFDRSARLQLDDSRREAADELSV